MFLAVEQISLSIFLKIIHVTALMIQSTVFYHLFCDVYKIKNDNNDVNLSLELPT